VDPVPDPLLLRKSGSAGDRTRDLCICSQKLWPLDHRGGHPFELTHHVIRREGGKEKAEKSQELSQLLALEEGKMKQLEKDKATEIIVSTQEDEDCHFLMSLLPHLRGIPKRRKLAVRLALGQVLIEEGNGESDRTEWSSGSSCYSSSTVSAPSSSYGMQSSESEHTHTHTHTHTLHITYCTTQPSQRYKVPPSTIVQLAEFIQFGK